MSKDTFSTIRYKGGFIHTVYDHEQRREVVTVTLPDGTLRTAKSFHGAKCILTRAEMLCETCGKDRSGKEQEAQP